MSMYTEILGQIVILITMISGYIYNIWRENRNRKWDLEDRERNKKELAATVTQSSEELARTTQMHQNKLIAKIDQNTRITQDTHARTNHNAAKLAAVMARFDATDANPERDTPNTKTVENV